MIDAQSSTSTRPYLIRALYEWCTDNGLTPYVAVQVDETVQVPREYVKDGEIVLNISFDATSSLKLGNDLIVFSARFAGKPREIMIPVDRVIAIYARENGQGMAFPRSAAPPSGGAEAPAEPAVQASPQEAPRAPDVDVRLVNPGTAPPPDGTGGAAPKAPGSGKRPKLTRIK
ncbi:MAG: ClpXP protease specificity-enhancing factor [Rhodoferax sp.]|jgi:stringent starvation protein B|nr:ClpXP protease specificity-enhancing factor [Rhodoferax sp.]